MARTPTERSSRTGLRIVFSLVVIASVFAAGVVAGQLAQSGPLPTTLLHYDAQAKQGGLEAHGPGGRILGAIASLAGAGAESPSPMERLAGPLLRSGGDTRVAVENMIDGMSDAELITAITSYTNLRSEDLADVRDLRSYARRLSAIAMDGVLAPAQPASTDTAAVLFADHVDPEGFPDEVWQNFGTDGERPIYALFPSADYTKDQVLVKWFREGDPELLLFARYPVDPGAPLSHVWMQRQAGWTEGPYVVEFYDPSESLEKIASGRYVIDDSSPAPQSANDEPTNDEIDASVAF